MVSGGDLNHKIATWCSRRRYQVTTQYACGTTTRCTWLCNRRGNAHDLCGSLRCSSRRSPGARSVLTSAGHQEDDHNVDYQEGDKCPKNVTAHCPSFSLCANLTEHPMG